MNSDRKQLIVQKIRQYMADKELSQNQVATQLGISAGHMSFVLNPDTWDKVGDKLWRMLDGRFLGFNWEIYQTSNFKSIQLMCQEAKRDAVTLCIPDYTGAGKTVGLTRFFETNPNTYYLLCDQMMSPKEMARELQRQIGINIEGTAREMIIIAINEILRREKPLIIIDEADKLSDRCLLTLKIMYDRLEDKCGFVTAGTEVLKDKIEKFARRNKLGYREWKRRFANYRTLRPFDTTDRIIRGEVVAMCQDNQIDDSSQVKHILKNATNFGDVKNLIRSMININQAELQLEEA